MTQSISQELQKILSLKVTFKILHSIFLNNKFNLCIKINIIEFIYVKIREVFSTFFFFRALSLIELLNTIFCEISK